MDCVRLLTNELQKQGERLGAIAIVVDHEYSAPLGSNPCCAIRLTARDTGQNRKTNFEPCALAMPVAKRRYRSTVHLNKLLHKGESDTQSTLRTLQRTVELRKHFKDGP